MKKKLLFLLALVCSVPLYAQTTITTNHTNNNGNGGITFHVQNTNAYDIIITDIQCHLGSLTTNNCQLLTNATPILDNAAPWSYGTIGDGQNGWVLQATSVVGSSESNGIVTAISGMNVVVPANTTYGFAFSATALRYMTLFGGAGTNTFTQDGVSILTGDGISWGSTAYPATPANYPRGFIGGITFYAALPCTSPPVAGSVTVVGNCSANAKVTVPDGGQGMSYQWQSSLTNDNFVSISGATSRQFVPAQPPANDLIYYRCYVTCGGLSDTTASVSVNFPHRSTTSYEVCYGEGLTINSQYLDAPGSYTQILTGAASNGCDSIVISNLSERPAVNTYFNHELCANKPLRVGTSIYKETGSYSDVLTDQYGCDSTVHSQITDLLPLQDVSTSVTGATIMATATGATYQWLDVDNGYAVIAGATDQTFTAPGNGRYAVAITENDHSCVDTSEAVNITVTDLTLFSTDGMAISLSPNPTTSSTKLKLSGVEFQNLLSEGITLVLVNTMNEILYRTTLYSDQTTIDLNDYASGVYFLQLKSGNKAITRRIVKNE